MLDHDEIRKRLRKRFDDLGLSLTGLWLKRDYGIGQTTVRNFLEGMSQSITIDTLAKLSEPLKTTEQWLLFGEPEASPISEDALREMVDLALEEIQPGMSLAEIRPAVSSALHAQLKRSLAAAAGLDRVEAESVRDIGAQSRAPTIRDVPVK